MKYWIIVMMVVMLGLVGLVGLTNASQVQTTVVHSTVSVTVYPLVPNTSAVVEGALSCSKTRMNKVEFGCTAIPGSTQYAYPFDSSTVTLDIEKEYLPHVVAQEMFPPEFHPEAVKAQARAARTYAYYQINTTTGEFDNSTNKQVFIQNAVEHPIALCVGLHACQIGPRAI